MQLKIGKDTISFDKAYYYMQTLGNPCSETYPIMLNEEVENISTHEWEEILPREFYKCKCGTELTITHSLYLHLDSTYKIKCKYSKEDHLCHDLIT